MSPKSNRRMRRRTGCTGICPPRTHSLQRMRTSWRHASATGLRQSNRWFLRHCLAQRGHPSEAIAANTASLERGAPFDTSTADNRKLRLSYSGLHLLVAARSWCADDPLARQGTPQVCRDPAVRRLWPHASEAHHIRFAQPRALGRKVSDEYMVPVCRLHHRELHRLRR